MKKPSLILVTGAAGGNQGSTGNHVARLLNEKNVPVRAFVHSIDERSDQLSRPGIEIVEGDLLNYQSVKAAMEGVQRAYFTYAVKDGLMEATTIFAMAAKECGVEMVVNISQLLERNGEQHTPHQERHWLAEHVFDWAGIGAVHLNAVVFFENLRALVKPGLSKGDTFFLPWGPEKTKIPMISAEDVARIAVALLTGPLQPNGIIIPLIGDVVTVGEIKDTLAEVLEKPVNYTEITDAQWMDAVSKHGQLNDKALEHLSHLWRHFRTRSKEYQDAYAITPATETLTGNRPKLLREFLEEQKQVFA